MNLSLIRQAHKVLNACGFVHEDRSGLYVPIEKKFLLPMVLTANQTATFQKEIVGPAVFALRAISSDVGMHSYQGVRLQIQMPNGRYLFGANGIDVGQFAWVGSWRYRMDEDFDCDPGSKISVSLSDVNTGGLAQSLAVNLVFEGCFKFYLNASPGPDDSELASNQNRYFGIVNENIIAPCWWHGLGPATPKGEESEPAPYTYSSPAVSLALAGPVATSTKIDIDNGVDFIVRRVLVDLEPDATVAAGAVLMRLRTGDGYALMDDFIDAARLIGGAVWPVDWTIRAGDEVIAEMALVDASGTGNMSVQIHLEGEKRRTA